MKTLSTIFNTAVLSLLTSSAALASAGATNKVFVSGPLVLLFLGFCALVVVVQCIPAIMMLIGMIKGAVSETKAKTVTAKK
ncbi:MAG: hypothetical protein LUP94_03650 [Candidatus Methanomethylicus sp.]|nr:hypothetical protein [Candidatus Methanomethylicus sp.]